MDCICGYGLLGIGMSEHGGVVCRDDVEDVEGTIMAYKSEHWCDGCKKPTYKYDNMSDKSEVRRERNDWSLSLDNHWYGDKESDERKDWRQKREIDYDLCEDCALKAGVAVKAALGLEKK